MSQLVTRSWWLLLLATAIAGIGGYAVATRLPRTYQSTATMLVGPINTDTGLDASGSLTATYESLATSRPVLSQAIASTGAHLTAKQLQTSVTTTSNSVSRLVTVTVSNRNPALAAQLANALAAKIAMLSRHSSKTTSEVITAFDQTPQIQALDAAQRHASEVALTRVLGASPAGQVTIVNPAYPAATAASPQKAVIAVLAAVAGFLIALLLLLGHANFPGTAAHERSLTELKQAYLGVVEISSTHDSADAVSVETRPNSSAAADYRMLAARLSLGGPTTQSLLVVDSNNGSAAAVVAANLAAALSEADSKSVLLADVSTEVDGVTKLLGLQGQQGYAELIAVPDPQTRKGRMGELLVDRSDHMFVLPRGKDEPKRMLSAEHARAVLERLIAAADIVVLAGPPMSRSPSGLSWARAASSVLLVVDGNKASVDEVMQVTNDLSLTNAHFLGTVIGRRRQALPMLGRAVTSRA